MNLETGLGPLIAVYRGSPLGRRDLVTLVIPGVLLVLAPLVAGMQFASTATRQYGPVAGDLWTRPWFLAASLAMLVFGLLALRRLHLARRSVTVYKEGLRLQLGFFKKRTLRFREIAGIATSMTQEQFLHWSLPVTYYATLYPGNGAPVLLAGYLQNLPELISRIKASLYPRLLPALRSALHNGQWLSFHQLSINRQGLRFRRRRLPWSQVQAVDVRAGYLIIQPYEEAVIRLPVERIPNLELLLQLIQEVSV